MKIKKLFLAVAVGACCLIGCREFQICGYQKDPQGRHGEIYHGSMYDNRLWWKGRHLWEHNWASCKSQTNTLYSVTVEQNYLFALISVASFGLWMPQKVYWRFNDDDPLSLRREKGVK